MIEGVGSWRGVANFVATDLILSSCPTETGGFVGECRTCDGANMEDAMCNE